MPAVVSDKTDFQTWKIDVTVTAPRTDTALPLSAFLHQLEVDARNESRRLENECRLSHGFTAQFYPLTAQEEQQGRKARAAWRLATDLDSLRALLAGKAVPRHKLDPEYLHLLERWPA